MNQTVETTKTLKDYQVILDDIYPHNPIFNLIEIDNNIVFEVISDKMNIKQTNILFKKEKELTILTCNKKIGYYKVLANKTVLERKKLDIIIQHQRN
ncbi:hypothetical protein SAMN04489761_3465 [Tenacibaculum sp. MAR_2009_124]|uniref:hypothetical protein n=1 Tax=Tenacibaculum sp. MAR_2009_124 TaxID=1250059 RepID=UPI000898F55D|nr:hypothetical protein [Tenacibaculum sp. MAR_2009_124]SEC67303.1 hypothetical protein SAMN04489761_3465 [Tenacibaculum sp. MAR_2009_124]